MCSVLCGNTIIRSFIKYLKNAQYGSDIQIGTRSEVYIGVKIWRLLVHMNWSLKGESPGKLRTGEVTQALLEFDISLQIWNNKGCKSKQYTEKRKPIGTMKNQQLVTKENVIMIFYLALKSNILKYL